mgnify:CR=1 FL=1
MPGDGWCLVIAVTKLSNDYGAVRVSMKCSALILMV